MALPAGSATFSVSVTVEEILRDSAHVQDVLVKLWSPPTAEDYPFPTKSRRK